MIKIEQAIQAAYKFLSEVPFSEDYVKSATIEEVELDENSSPNVWKITLGFPGKVNIFNPTGVEKNLKVFYVNTETGIVNAMKIREKSV